MVHYVWPLEPFLLLGNLHFMSQNNEQLESFISRARAAGKSAEEIKASLLSAGWSAEVVATYVASGDALLPPPPPPAKTSGRDIFFYLLAFFTLAISAFGLGAILFSFINRFVPDEVGRTFYGRDTGLQWALASFLVAAPVYFAIMWKVARDLNRGVAEVRSRVRKVLTYLAMFLASATVIGDVIALVYRFVAGEVNTRFLLKVLVILLIGGWVIWYYWVSLKHDDRVEHSKQGTISSLWQRGQAIAFVVVAVVALVAGFWLSGSPASQQKVVRDEQRVSDLQSIYYGIQSYYQTKQALPASLEELYKGYQPTIPSDVQSRQPYEYIVGTGGAYQLCATFELASTDLRDTTMPQPIYSPDQVNWTHPAGRYCFALEAVVAIPFK